MCTYNSRKGQSKQIEPFREPGQQSTDKTTECATSGKPSTWLPLERLVKQILREEKSKHAHTTQIMMFQDFENSQGASRRVQDHSRVSPITPGHHLSGPESIMAAWIVRLFPSLISVLGMAPAQPKSIDRDAPLRQFRSYVYLSFLKRPFITNRRISRTKPAKHKQHIEWLRCVAGRCPLRRYYFSNSSIHCLLYESLWMTTNDVTIINSGPLKWC